MMPAVMRVRSTSFTKRLGEAHYWRAEAGRQSRLRQKYWLQLKSAKAEMGWIEMRLSAARVAADVLAVKCDKLRDEKDGESIALDESRRMLDAVVSRPEKTIEITEYLPEWGMRRTIISDRVDTPGLVASRLRHLLAKVTLREES